LSPDSQPACCVQIPSRKADEYVIGAPGPGEERPVPPEPLRSHEVISLGVAAAAARTANRTAPSSGSTVFVSQAYVPQAHHSAATRSAPRSSPSPVQLAARKPVTWVMAKTKTRSKNSSRGVTRS
jgi:hypothetical protein